MFWKGFEKLCKTIKESIFSNVTDLFNSKSIPGLLDIQGALEGHLKGTLALQECLSSRALEGHSGTSFSRLNWRWKHFKEFYWFRLKCFFRGKCLLKTEVYVPFKILMLAQCGLKIVKESLKISNVSPKWISCILAFRNYY